MFPPSIYNNRLEPGFGDYISAINTGESDNLIIELDINVGTDFTGIIFRLDDGISTARRVFTDASTGYLRVYQGFSSQIASKNMGISPGNSIHMKLTIEDSTGLVEITGDVTDSLEISGLTGTNLTKHGLFWGYSDGDAYLDNFSVKVYEV
jgi:hypothetical protein